MSRRVVGLIVAAAVVAGAAVGGWTWRERAGRSPAPAPVHAGLRQDLLASLADRLVPTASGGWTAVAPGEPVVPVWLRAAAATGETASFDRAVAAARQAFADDVDSRSIGLALAQVLPGPTADPAAADRLAAEVLDRARERLDGEPAWLGVLLQLSAGSTSASEGATAELVRRAGPARCDRLPEHLPDPATSLTVAVRILAAAGRPCDEALPLLDAALGEPSWSTWIATAELADLARLVPDLPPATRARLEARLASFLAVGPDAPIDLGALTAVQAAWRAVGIDGTVPTPLARHAAGQVAQRGGLPGRSTSPPTGFDVAILRQLVGDGQVPIGALRSTEEAAVWPEVSGRADPVLDRLLVERAPLRCSDAPEAAPERARPTFEGIAADQAWATVRASCAGRLDLPAMVRELAASGDDQRALRIAVAELAACRIDPSLPDAVAGRRLPATGPFAADPLQVWARSVAADPAAACAAVR